MSPSLIIVSVLCFAVGIGVSIWQTRRRFRARLADRLAREVERELARRVVADLQRGAGTARPPES
jgi:hypothetical protein